MHPQKKNNLYNQTGKLNGILNLSEATHFFHPLFRFYIAIAFCTPVQMNAQIVYTDINPDKVISASASEQFKSYFLDLNNDGNYEFELQHFNPGPGNEEVEIKQNSTGVQQLLLETNGHSRVIKFADTIGPASTQWGLDANAILNSPWYGGGDKYFGIRFKINAQWHYGWARVSIPSDHLSFTIKDYAYNQIPDSYIRAGQTSITGLINYKNDEPSLLSIVPNPLNMHNNIRIMNAESIKDLNNAFFILYENTGRKINCLPIINGNQIEISHEALQPGYYFYELILNNARIMKGKLMLTE